MKRILIIEDEMFVASAYSHRLETAGYVVRVAKDGEDGLLQVELFKPHLIQLDLNIPLLNGVEIIKWVRASEAYKSLPIVVLTYGYISTLVREAWQAGATKVLTKADCTPKIMEEVIGKLFAAEAARAKPSSHRPASPSPSIESPRFFASAGASEDDAAFEQELRATFRDTAKKDVVALTALHRGQMKADDPASTAQSLVELRRRVRSIASSGAVVGYTHVARMASAIEAFLKEMHDRPELISISTQRTVAMAIDRLAQMLNQLRNCSPPEEENPVILIVDDDIISRKAVERSVKKVGLGSTTVEDPFAALEMLNENRVDLVILDIDMPAMNGLELCRRLRAMPAHAQTPVIFVTAMNDFENRVQSTLSGGADVIGKPFHFLELGVKVLIHLFRRAA